MTIQSEQKHRCLRWKFAGENPLPAFLLLAFGWSWMFWLGAIPWKESQPLLVMALVFIGGYGPALGAVLTLGLKNGLRPDFSGRKLILAGGAAALIFALFTVRYLVGGIPGYDRLPADLPLSSPVAAAILAASLLGGWVISSAASGNAEVRERMGTILPLHLKTGWALVAGGFFPALLLASWGLAAALGIPVEMPAVWQYPPLTAAGLFVLAFALTALARGGLEEPGWRGLMQPFMEKSVSPLSAAVIVSLFWSLWHLPLFLNGFYPEDLLAGMIGGGVYRILLAVALAWFFSKTGGSIFLMVVMHTTFNLMVNYIPFSDTLLAGLLFLAVIAMIVESRMWRKPAGNSNE